MNMMLLFESEKYFFFFKKRENVFMSMSINQSLLSATEEIEKVFISIKKEK